MIGRVISTPSIVRTPDECGYGLDGQWPMTCTTRFMPVSLASETVTTDFGGVAPIALHPDSFV